MTHLPPKALTAQHRLSAIAGADLRVVSGVNQGDVFHGLDDICLGDGYAMRAGSKMSELELVEQDRPDRFWVAGDVSRPMQLEAKLTFIESTGAAMRALAIAGEAGAFLYPLSPIAAGVEYTLIDVDLDVNRIPSGTLTGLSFGRGTRITLSDGSQCPVDNLNVGDRVLTRDHGMQPIRWIGKRTLRSVGSFAPVVINHGELGNAENITVSQQHRMLISDWRAEVMVGARDVLIAAGDLINDDTIFLRPGGFIEYTQLVLDAHEIIYAEGIPTESLAVTRDLLSGLSEEDAAELMELFPDLPAGEPAFSRIPLESQDAVKLLRQTGRF